MIKKIISTLLLSIILLTTVSCGGNSEPEPEPEEYYSSTFYTMDTVVTVKLARDTGERDAEENILYHDDSHLSSIIKECADIATREESLLSRTDENSAVSELNTQTDYFLKIDPELMSLIEEANLISDNTNGAFDITVGTLTELWNVTGENTEVPSDESIEEALTHVGHDKVVTEGESLRKNDRNTKFDFGAIGKGYTLGKIIDYLKTTNVMYGLVSFGGNVGVFGAKQDGAGFKIGITDASDTSKVSGYVFVDSGFVSVSGDYERFFISDRNKYCHIFDPSTGRPADKDISSVAVVCEDSSLADALSTALFVKGSEGALEFYNSKTYEFESVIQTKAGELILTEGLKNGSNFEKYTEPVESAED